MNKQEKKKQKQGCYACKNCSNNFKIVTWGFWFKLNVKRQLANASSMKDLILFRFLKTPEPEEYLRDLEFRLRHSP